MNQELPKDAPISAVAQHCLRTCGNDIAKAQTMMASLVHGHPPLFAKLMFPLVENACYDALRSVLRADRAQIWTAPNYTQAGNGSRLDSLARSMLDIPLPNGTLLRHAHKEDLLDAAKFYMTQAKDMAHKAKWLQTIAKRVGSKTVGEKFTDVALRQLQEATA